MCMYFLRKAHVGEVHSSYWDDATVKMNASNQLYVAKVSTDVLEQGSQVLILNGGTAEG